MEKDYGKVSKQNIEQKSNTSKKISMWALCMMSVLMIYSFSNIVYNYVALGWTAAPAFLLAIGIYLIPFAFVIAEFASLRKAKGAKSGLMKWVEIGIGRKLAFLTAFMFWFANLTYFMGALPGFAVSLGFATTGKDLTGTKALNIAIPLFGVFMFFIITYFSTKSTRSMSKLTTIGGTFTLGITLFFFLIAIIAYIAMMSGVDGYGSINESGFFAIYGENSEGDLIFEGFETTTEGVWIPAFNDYAVVSGANDFVDNVVSELEEDGYLTLNEKGEIEGGWIDISVLAELDSTQGLMGRDFIAQFDLANNDIMRFRITSSDGEYTFWLDHTYVSPQAPGVVSDGVAKNIWGNSDGHIYVWLTVFVWVLMAADGAQGLGVYVDDVKGGQKTFIKGLLISVMLIGTMYIIGTFLLAVFPGDSLSNSNYLTLSLMFYYILGNMGVSKEASFMITNILLGWLFLTTGFGCVLMWTAAPVRTMFSESDTGLFGSYITKKNQHGVPYRGAWLQFIIVVPLFTIPFIGLEGINEFLEMIKTAGGSLGMIPPIMIFAAYINLRVKHDDEERTFRCGSRGFGIFMGIFIFIVYSWIFLMAFFPYAPGKDNWWIGTALNVCALLFVFVPVLFWYLSYEVKQRNLRIAIRNNLDPALIQIHYSNNKYLYASKEEKIRKQLDADIHSLQKKYNDLYDEVISLDLDLKAKKAKLVLLDKEYKKEYKLLMVAFKAAQKEIKLAWKETAQIEFEKLIPFIENYKNNIREIKKANKLAYQEKIALAIQAYNELDPELKATKKAEFKEKLSELKAKHKEELKEIVAKTYLKIDEIEEEFERKTASIDSKDTILEFKALKDTDIALAKFYLVHEKRAAKEIQNNEVLALKAKYLGEKYLILLEQKQALKLAIKNSEKTFIDNYYIEENTIYNTDEYEPTAEAKIYAAIRQYSMFNPKKITDEVILDGDKLIVKYIETDKIITDIYKIDDINLYLDRDERKARPFYRADQKELMLINLVNNDKFLTLHEEFFVENYHDLMKNFKQVKELN